MVSVKYKFDGNFSPIAEDNGDVWQVVISSAFQNAGFIESEYQKYFDYLTFAYKKDSKKLRFIRVTSCSYNIDRTFHKSDFLTSKETKSCFPSQYNALLTLFNSSSLFSGYSFYD